MIAVGKQRRLEEVLEIIEKMNESLGIKIESSMKPPESSLSSYKVSVLVLTIVDFTHKFHCNLILRSEEI